MTGAPARWVALLVGLGVGLLVGLTYTLLIDPVQLTNTYPALLGRDQRDDWVQLAALSLVVEGDLTRALARLDGLDVDETSEALQTMIHSTRFAEAPPEAWRRLSALAEAYGLDLPAAMSAPYLTSGDSTDAESGSSRATLSETTASARPSALSYTVVEQVHVCRSSPPSRVEVVVTDVEGDGVPGVRVWLLWAEGADWAVTGLKPSQGLGYADLGAEPGTVYSLGLGEIGMPLITNLQLNQCSVDGDGAPGYGSCRIAVGPRVDDALPGPCAR